MTSGAPRVAVVTGAGGAGCGRAIALRFAADGAAVVASDRDETGARETARLVEAAGGRASFLKADVKDESQVRDLIEFAEATYGRVSVLVNNASAIEAAAAGMAGWIESLQTDLMGAMYAMHWAIEAMRRGGGGSIVNISSISALWHGRTKPGGFPAYDAAKAGMLRLTTGLASLAQTDNIRVNCLAPGWIATEGPRQYWESLTPAERVERGVPARLLQPLQIADIVLRMSRDGTLAGRVVIWWSEDPPRLIRWGDRGYVAYEDFAHHDA
ncbi:MAG TPA: SDR family oxidoreductase [Vicinamibacterales bacterium]|nr:SDR family oxidoreductase [Vicinamibacterales bacterium]